MWEGEQIHSKVHIILWFDDINYCLISLEGSLCTYSEYFKIQLPVLEKIK